MEKATVEAVEPRAPDDEDIPAGAQAESVGNARVLTELLGTTDLSINHYTLALGAPREYQYVTEWLVECEACDEETVHTFEEADNGTDYVYRCSECDGETFRVSS